MGGQGEAMRTDGWSRWGALTVSALLVALPLLAVAVVALRALDLEVKSRTAQETEAALAQLRSAETRLRRDLERLGDETIARVATIRSVQDLRESVRHDEVDFIAVYQGERRLCPPDDGSLLGLSESNMLHHLAGAMASLRADLTATPAPATRQTVLRRLGQPGPALLHCRREDSERDICVLLGADKVEPSLRAGLLEAEWQVTLIAPGGDGQASNPADASLVLGPPLPGWRLDARRPPDAPPLPLGGAASAAIVVPLLVCWLALAWHFHQGQTARLAEAAWRAGIAAQLSHDLRTPLANLRLFAELVERCAGSAQSVRDYSAIMGQEIERLTHLAENTIAYAKGSITDGVPDHILGEVVERFQPLLAQTGNRVTVTGGAAAPCRFDTAALQRIAINLLDNARKYAPGSSIRIATARDGAMLRLTVEDDGPGIPQAERHRIFEPLMRGPRPEIAGFGLGLAAVRRLAQAQGGDAMLADAEAGAHFIVTMKVS